jgi:hypothetical protein
VYQRGIQVFGPLKTADIDDGALAEICKRGGAGSVSKLRRPVSSYEAPSDAELERAAGAREVLDTAGEPRALPDRAVDFDESRADQVIVSPSCHASRLTDSQVRKRN